MKNKNLLITGAATRIGKEIALHFSKKGWNIAIHYFKSSFKAKNLKKIIEENSVKAALIKADLKNIKQELLKRIYLPLYLPLFALVACFLILKSKDNPEYTNFKFKLFLIGIIFLIISEISIRYAGLNNKYNLIFIITPIILFLLMRIIFNNQLRFEK
mgnify:CR=1 FL=1